jgi:hypothetical protein
MFSPWTPASATGGAAVALLPTVAPLDNRSRTPSGLLTSSAGANYPGIAHSPDAHLSVTGNPRADAWYHDNVSDQDVKVKFMEMPVYRRKNIILKAMDRPPDNLESWLVACHRNWVSQELEKRVAGGASVHGRGNYQQHVPPHGAMRSAQSDGLHQPAHGSIAPSPGAGMSEHDPIGQYSMAPSSGTVPTWAPEMHACWPSQKSRLMGRFLSLLHGDVQARVCLLPPPTQASLAFALMVAGSSDSPSPDVLVKQWLLRLDSLNHIAPTASEVSLPSQDPSQKIQLQIIMTGESAPLSVMTTKAFQGVMSRLRGEIQWDLLPTVCIADGDAAGASARDAGRRLRVNLNDTVHDFNTLNQYLTSNIEEFKGHHTKFFFVNVLSTRAFENASSEMASESDLHCKSTRWVWNVVRLSHDLRLTVGDSNVMELTLAPPHASPKVVARLESLFGPLVIESKMGCEYNQVAPVPCVFGVPSDFVVTKCHDDQDTAGSVLDGWAMLAEPARREKTFGPGLLSMICKAAESKLFEERPLTPAESSALATYRVKHNTTGEERLCSRDWWMRWWGFHQTPHQTFLDTEKPCSRTIISVTGLRAEESSSCAKACGRDRYCKACEEVFQSLENTFSFPAVIDCMVAIMNKALKTWKDGRTSDEWVRASVPDRLHACGADCSLRSGGPNMSVRA